MYQALCYVSGIVLGVLLTRLLILKIILQNKSPHVTEEETHSGVFRIIIC